MKKNRVIFAAVAVTTLVVLSFLGCVRKAAPITVKQPLLSNQLLSVKSESAPTLDGQTEGLWDRASSVTVAVGGGANVGSTEVTLKSVYSRDSVYFLVQWADPSESLRRTPWQKQSDNSWQKLSTSTTHQENTNYEDKLAFLWNINDSIAGFNDQGCMITCHVGEQPANSGFGSKYTANPGEMGDIWHWKSVRTNPVNQSDDQYVDSMRYDKSAAPGAGRHADPKTGGGYANNQTDDKKLPAFGVKDNKSAPPYWIVESQKVSFADDAYKPGDEIPGIIVSAFSGDRGDISAKGVYKDGKWTVELQRKLSTGSQYDVQFSDLSKSYFFGVAIFDNAQVNHAWNNDALELRFAK